MHQLEFKAKVGLEAVRRVKTVNQIAQNFRTHPLQVSQCKHEIQPQAKTLSEGKCPPTSPLPPTAHLTGGTMRSVSSRWNSIGSKKFMDQLTMIRRSWIDVHGKVTQKLQCVLASVARDIFYAQCKPKLPDEVLKRLVDEEECNPPHPFYGSMKMVAHLVRCDSRRVLRWSIRNTMEAMFCVNWLEDVLRRHDGPEIFNSDQGT